MHFLTLPLREGRKSLSESEEFFGEWQATEFCG
jgi:hypothetical protein